MKRIFLSVLIIFVGLSFGKAQTRAIKKVAILEVVDRDNAFNYGMKLLLRTTLSKAITQTEGYEGYDRVDMRAIQGEHDFQRTGMVSAEQIKRLGEMTGASYVLVAEVAKIDVTNIIVTAKILDVETAKLERTDYEQMGIEAQEMSAGCQVMAGRLLVPMAKDLSQNKVAIQTERSKNIVREDNVIRKGTRLLVEDRYAAQTKMTEVQKRDYLGSYYKNWKMLEKKRNETGITLMSIGSSTAFVGLICGSVVGFYPYYYVQRRRYDYYKQKYVDDSYWEIDGAAVAGYVLLPVGLAMLIPGITTYVKAQKKMDEILLEISAQQGVRPYRSEMSLNFGYQPHGLGLSVRF